MMGSGLLGGRASNLAFPPQSLGTSKMSTLEAGWMTGDRLFKVVGRSALGQDKRRVRG
jgi:hypothetical protein